jgi:hypothetical protein
MKKMFTDGILDGWMAPGASVDAVEEEKIPCLGGNLTAVTQLVASRLTDLAIHAHNK